MLVFLDTETTGLMANYHEIFEISIIRVSDKVQLSRKIKVKNPKNASLEVLQITGKNISVVMKTGKNQNAPS